MNADAFTTAAMEHLAKVDHDKSRDWFNGFVACTAWARDHLAAHSDLTVESEAVTVESDEPTDAEVEAEKGARA